MKKFIYAATPFVFLMFCCAVQCEEYRASIELISEPIAARIVGKSWELTCPVPLEDLRYLKISHWGYDDQVHQGEMIVHKDVASEVVEIFKELFVAKFPIERMRLIDDYFQPGKTKGEIDDSSIRDNNSSAFFFRLVGKTNFVSEHGLGTAIDINPLVNPLVRQGADICPAESQAYSDRTRTDVKGMVTASSDCVRIFLKHNWKWAGNWKKLQDYQHFCKIQEDSVQ